MFDCCNLLYVVAQQDSLSKIAHNGEFYFFYFFLFCARGDVKGPKVYLETNYPHSLFYFMFHVCFALSCSMMNIEDESKTPLLSPRSFPEPTRNYKFLSLTLLSLVTWIVGVVQYIPLALLVPESLDLGLSTIQAALILAAWPVSSLLTLFLQPHLNQVPPALYLVALGGIEALGFASFYFSVQAGTWYMWLAVLARFTAGTAHFLIRNKTAVGFILLFSGDVNKSTLTFEIFNSAGQAVGAYIGSVISAHLGFLLTMVTAGALMFVSMIVAALVFPDVPAPEQESGDDVMKLYWLHVSRDQVSSSAMLLSQFTS